jgi:hypothetical protein
MSSRTLRFGHIAQTYLWSNDGSLLVTLMGNIPLCQCVSLCWAPANLRERSLWCAPFTAASLRQFCTPVAPARPILRQEPVPRAWPQFQERAQ